MTTLSSLDYCTSLILLFLPSTYFPHTFARVNFLKYKSEHVTKIFHWFPNKPRIKFKPMTKPMRVIIWPLSVLPSDSISTTLILTILDTINFLFLEHAPTPTPAPGHFLVPLLWMHFPSSSVAVSVSSCRAQLDHHLLRKISHEPPTHHRQQGFSIFYSAPNLLSILHYLNVCISFSILFLICILTL